MSRDDRQDDDRVERAPGRIISIGFWLYCLIAICLSSVNLYVMAKKLIMNRSYANNAANSAQSIFFAVFFKKKEKGSPARKMMWFLFFF